MLLMLTTLGCPLHLWCLLGGEDRELLPRPRVADELEENVARCRADADHELKAKGDDLFAEVPAWRSWWSGAPLGRGALLDDDLGIGGLELPGAAAPVRVDGRGSYLGIAGCHGGRCLSADGADIAGRCLVCG